MAPSAAKDTGEGDCVAGLFFGVEKISIPFSSSWKINSRPGEGGSATLGVGGKDCSGIPIETRVASVAVGVGGSTCVASTTVTSITGLASLATSRIL